MKKIVIGIIIMMAGAFLLLNNMGFIIPEVYHIVISWQALLIAIGVVILFDSSPNNQSAGITLIVIGALFLFPKIFSVSVSGIVLPVLIIAAGIGLVIRATTGKKIERYAWERSKWKKYFSNYDRTGYGNGDYDANVTINKEGVISKEYVFTGSKEKWTQVKLKDVEIEAIFSGVEIDLSQAELADDVKVAVHIRVKSVFSGVVLYVPEDWNITVQKTGVFGGFTDNRPNRVLKIASDKLIILEVESVFGGGEIRCYE